MSETLGEAMNRLEREISELRGVVGWVMRRRMRRLKAKRARERDRAIRRYWTS